MNHWPFIIASYGITLAALIGLTGWSYFAMRRAEQSGREPPERIR